MRKEIRIGAAALGCAVAITIAGGCTTRRLSEGATPFPSKIAIFTDQSGKELVDLPPSSEPLRLILLDFPWCPPCSDTWDAVAAASKTVPGGNVRVYRILFDREKFDTARGTSETSPIAPPPPPPAVAFPVTTVTALPTRFREGYRFDLAPVLLLSDDSGKILKKWTGYTPGLADSLRGEIGRRIK